MLYIEVIDARPVPDFIMASTSFKVFGNLDWPLRTKMKLKPRKSKKGEILLEDYLVNIQGAIKIERMPRYMQSGEMMIVSAERQYLVIEIVKIDFLEALSNYGDPSV